MMIFIYLFIFVFNERAYSFSCVNLCTLLVLVCFRVNNEDVRLMLWDTAGQEEFDAITKAYYRGEKDQEGLL